jgi:hypothetical protein
MSWAEEGFQDLDLGDKNLIKRTLLAERLAAKPTASIPGACGGWAETQAAYRFLAQDDVDWTDILTSHLACSKARVREHEVILCLQDTPELNLNGQSIAGLGPLSSATWHVCASHLCRQPVTGIFRGFGCMDVVA